jgi:glycosyltransferase involved in cell wall biosynthesis
VQKPLFDFEIIVVDDGSPDLETEAVCIGYAGKNLRYYRINREPGYRNPAIARNFAYERANGEVLIPQSDDVVHVGPTVSNLVTLLREGVFIISTVYNKDFATGEPVYYAGRWYQLTGPKINAKFSPNPHRPLFFLGAVYRKDVYAIGGCDEDFVDPGREDIWFADCLMNGLKLKPYYTAEVVGHHLHHERPDDLNERVSRSSSVYQKKRKEAARTGIWKARKGLKKTIGADDLEAAAP